MEKKKLFLYGAACCILLGLIMALLNTLKVSFSAYGFSASQTAGMTDELTIFKILIILLDLAAIAALLLPAFGVLADKAALLRLCAIGAAVLSAIIFIICLFVAKGKVGGDGISVHFSFVGWLLLIFHLGGAALAFLNSKEQ